jgi:hypothetical protein
LLWVFRGILPVRHFCQCGILPVRHFASAAFCQCGILAEEAGLAEAAGLAALLPTLDAGLRRTVM